MEKSCYEKKFLSLRLAKCLCYSKGLQSTKKRFIGGEEESEREKKSKEVHEKISLFGISNSSFFIRITITLLSMWRERTKENLIYWLRPSNVSPANQKLRGKYSQYFFYFILRFQIYVHVWVDIKSEWNSLEANYIP